MLAMLAGACSAAGTVGRPLQSPEYASGLAKCHAGASITKPLVVEWPSAARAELEAIVEDHRSVAVVRYEGCTMQVLTGCSANGDIKYVPYRNTKQDLLRITSADDLYANLPMGAASLEAKLDRAGELDVDMMLVGQYEASDADRSRGNLRGGPQCAGATHIVKTLTVGAFDFHSKAKDETGGGANVLGAGAGASSSDSQDTIARDGMVDACGAAKIDDRDAPQNCGALVRLEVVELVDGSVTPNASAPSASSSSSSSATPTTAPSVTPSASASASASPPEVDPRVAALDGVFPEGTTVTVRNGELMLIVPADMLFTTSADQMLSADGETLASRIAIAIRDNRTLSKGKIVVVGYTDDGRAHYQQGALDATEMTAIRANNVLASLRAVLGLFFPSSYRGVGADDPIAGVDGADRKKNRRIEIWFR
jgi:flagellar motor protein MotB